MTLGRVDQEIGKRAGVSHETVRKVETLMQKAPERVQQSLRSGDISINHAFEDYRTGRMQEHAAKLLSAQAHRERIDEGEEEEEDQEGEPHKERKRSPEVIYKEFMNSVKKSWTALYDYPGMPGPDTDMETKILQPSERYRLRLLKGLPGMERKALTTQISQFCIAGVGFLKYASMVQSQEPRVSPGWDYIRKNEHPDDDDKGEDSDSAEG